jgi:hypothetical protein
VTVLLAPRWAAWNGSRVVGEVYGRRCAELQIERDGVVKNRSVRLADISGLISQGGADGFALSQGEAEDTVDGPAVHRQSDAAAIRRQRLDPMFIPDELAKSPDPNCHFY